MKQVEELIIWSSWGMGEPLANLLALLPALDIILSPQGLGIGARHITLSTSGLVPKILELANYPAQIRLAISLHGGDDELAPKLCQSMNAIQWLNSCVLARNSLNREKR